MKRLILACILALSATVYGWSYLGLEAITVAGTAIGFTTGCINVGTGCDNNVSHNQATTASCSLETANVRYTYDGTTPTTTVGTLWQVGETRTFNGNDVLNNFLAIRTTSTSGTLQCNYAAP